MIGAFKSIGIAADRYDKSRYDQYFDKVSLLLHFNNNLTDSSTTGAVFSTSGTAALSSVQSRYGGYSLSTTGPGNGTSYTTSTNTTALSFPGDFAIECWVFYTTSGNGGEIISARKTNTGAVRGDWYIDTANKLVFIEWNAGVAASTLTSSLSVPVNSWVHVCVCKSGSVISQYISGVKDSNTVSSSLTHTAEGITVGATGYTLGYSNFPGYIDELRVTKFARYTSNFTPPIYQFADLWNDSTFSSVGLLLHCDGTNGSTSFPDSGPLGVSVTSNGGASVSTASPKFGTGALSLNGSGQNLSFQSSSFNVGSGAWTLEGWVNMNAGFTQYKRIFGYCAAAPTLPSDESIILEVTQTTGTLGVYAAIGSAYTTIFDSVAITTGSWVHVAAVSTGSTLYLFKNGTFVGSTALSGAINFNAAWTGYIGKWPGSSLRDFSGFIDDFRFTKGVARYTSTFTPPALPFPNF